MERPALKMSIFTTTALLLLTASFAPCSFAEVSLPEWSGSIKSLNLYGQQAPAGLFPDYKLSSNRFRLNMDWQPIGSWRLESALDYQYLWSDPAGAFPLSSKDINRRLDMDKIWQHGDHGASRLQVDRLNVQWRAEALDATVGRQAIGFGRILIYSPLDVIAPFAPDAIDTDVRGGVDALRSVFNYGLDGQLGAIAVWGESARDNSFLATWSDNRAGIDLLMIGGQLRGHSMIGAGIAGSLGTLGLKTEVSVHEGRDVGKIGGDLESSYALAAVEAWYRFNNGISLVSQYLYNGPGANEPQDYLNVLNSAPIREGLTYLIGQHYLILAPSYELHPLVTAQGILIYNLEDHSAMTRPTLDLNLADNLTLQLFWTAHTGKKPLFVSEFLPPQPRSEFGLRGDSGGVFLKWFF